MQDRLYPTYGQLAQTVNPNPKCEGCLHYAANQGASGVCQIGLRPFNCGDGEAPSIGYSPLAATGPDRPMEIVTSVQAPEVGGEPSRDVAQKTVSLGEEHFVMVKSYASALEENASRSCPIHQQKSFGSGQSNLASPIGLVCQCESVSDGVVAGEFYRALSNQERASLTDEQVLDFVHKARIAKQFREVSLMSPAARARHAPQAHDFGSDEEDSRERERHETGAKPKPATPSSQAGTVVERRKGEDDPDLEKADTGAALTSHAKVVHGSGQSFSPKKHLGLVDAAQNHAAREAVAHKMQSSAGHLKLAKQSANNAARTKGHEQVAHQALAYAHEQAAKKYEKAERHPSFAKSLYAADEWLAQFKGTPHFSEACKLHEEEIANAEKDLSERKKSREQAAKQPKPSPGADNWQVRQEREDALRIKKQKLMQKLHTHQHKQMGGK